MLFQAITDHEDIAEAAVVAKPDKLKGHIPVGICVLKAGKIFSPEFMFSVMYVVNLLCK